MDEHRKKITAPIGLAFLAAIIVLVSVPQGGARAQSGQSVFAAELLQPHLVDVGGGRRMNIHCVGTGSPTIVFEQGGNGLISDWAKVQRAVSSLSRTCFYDRAGFGYSDPPDKPVTALSVTDDLHTLLSRAGITVPVVLVGHSIGGFYATMYADRFPEQVAGLVLVDPAFTGQQLTPTPDSEQASERRGEGYLVACAALAREGRLSEANLADNHCYTLPEGSTPDETRYIAYAITRPYWYEAEESQSVNYFSADDRLSVSQRQEIEASHPFGDMPMIVLSSGIPPKEDGLSETQSRQLNEHQWAGHQKLARRSSQGRWMIVQGSHHFIWKDNPQAVLDAIKEVVNTAETRAAGAG